MPPSKDLMGLVNGYQVSQAIHVAATLGIADAVKDGARSSDDLATLTGTHPPSLYRLLRALASIGVLREEDDRRFALTPLGNALRSDVPQSLAGWAAFIGRPYHWEAWAHLIDSVRTGANAFRLTHGADVWDYRRGHPDETVIFDRAMTSLTRVVDRAVLDAFDFGRFGTVVDVGGGHGALLAAMLARYPAMRGVLFDQPHVVALAGEVLEAAGVKERCRVVSGSFFEAVPEGADAHLLKSIVHDWEDDEAKAILRSCRNALAAGGAVLVIERELGRPNESREAKFSDLNVLVGPGGRERTRDEYEALFAASDFRFVASTPTDAGLVIMEATAV